MLLPKARSQTNALVRFIGFSVDGQGSQSQKKAALSCLGFSGAFQSSEGQTKVSVSMSTIGFVCPSMKLFSILTPTIISVFSGLYDFFPVLMK